MHRKELRNSFQNFVNNEFELHNKLDNAIISIKVEGYKLHYTRTSRYVIIKMRDKILEML